MTSSAPVSLRYFGLAIILTFTPLGAVAQEPAITVRSASEALQFLLDRNIEPGGGPLTGDGATIAGVLAGQSLTFPIASSSGAFVTKHLFGFGPRIPAAISGSFGSLFAERGLTNGRSNLSVSMTFQHKTWRSVSGIDLKGFDMVGRAVFRNDVPGQGPTGTVEEFAADIDFQTDVLVLAMNYGLLASLDVGLSVPYVRSTVAGTKRRTRTVPQTEVAVLTSQNVSGSSEGFGDLIARIRYRVPLGRGGEQPAAITRRFHLAISYDLRVPTGKTAKLYLDCSRPPCLGGATQDVPDVGLGKRTQKISVLASTVLGRFSPHLNVGRIWVPSYDCDERRFGSGGHCKGSIYAMDVVNGTQDAKNQNLSDEWNAVFGLDYEVVPYRATASVDVIGRQLIRAGQFYRAPARLGFDERTLEPNRSVGTEVDARHGNINSLLGAVGTKIGFNRQWVLTSTLLFPLNAQGLQPTVAWVVGIERSFARH